METSPPVLCPYCWERSTRVTVVERNGDLTVTCFNCGFPIRVPR
jgi:hypothetical protein